MSIEAIAWAWRQEVDLPSVKLVLLALADHADKQGTCWPSFERVGAMTGLSQPTIWRAMNHLTGTGLVHQAQQGRGYRFSLAINSIQNECKIVCNTIQNETNPATETIHLECNRDMVSTSSANDTIHGETDSIHGEMDTIQDECLTVMNHNEPLKKERAEPKLRLPAAWQPDAKLMAWAQERAPHVDTTLETEKFLDHFLHIKPDRRTDQGWDASWRNWMLRARRDYTPAPVRFPTRSERTSQRNASILGDALADRPSAHDSVRDIPSLPFRLIEGGKD